MNFDLRVLLLQAIVDWLTAIFESIVGIFWV